MKLAVCQPPYANRTGTSAAPKASADRGTPVTVVPAGGAAASGSARQPNATSMATAPILSTMNVLWRLLPARTPKQLTAVRASRVVAAMAPSDPGMPDNSRK